MPLYLSREGSPQIFVYLDLGNHFFSTNYQYFYKQREIAFGQGVEKVFGYISKVNGYKPLLY